MRHHCQAGKERPDLAAYCRYVLIPLQPLVLRATPVKTAIRRERRDTGMKVLKGGRLIDGTGAAPVSGATVVIRGERIEAVTTKPAGEWPHDAEIIDVSGMTILPGLIDCHDHMAMHGYDLARRWGIDEPQSTRTLRTAKVLEQTLAMGYTAVRDAAGLDAGFKRAIDEGLISGPRLAHCDRGRHRFDRARLLYRRGARIARRNGGARDLLCADLCGVRFPPQIAAAAYPRKGPPATGTPYREPASCLRRRCQDRRRNRRRRPRSPAERARDRVPRQRRSEPASGVAGGHRMGR